MGIAKFNSLDPDQKPRSAASDLGLHCIPMSPLWDARHKWVNTNGLYDYEIFRNIAHHFIFLIIT